MSRATELAKAEADAVEAEDVPEDEREDAIDEPERDAEDDALEAPDELLDEDAIEAAFVAHIERHADGLRKLMGAEFESFKVCAVCDGLGYRHESKPLVDETLETCPVCAGHGFRLTGSVNPSYASQPCGACGAQGFRHKVETPPVQAAPNGIEVRYIDRATGLEVPAPPPGVPPVRGDWAPGYEPAPTPVPAGYGG